MTSSPLVEPRSLAEHFAEIDHTSTRFKYLDAPNVVLQGIASSMTEPALNTAPTTSSSAMPPSESNPGKLVSAAALAKPFIDAITEQITQRVKEGKNRPRLVGILATPSPPSIAYAEWTKKACESVGMEFVSAGQRREREGGQG